MSRVRIHFEDSSADGTQYTDLVDWDDFDSMVEHMRKVAKETGATLSGSLYLTKPPPPRIRLAPPDKYHNG